MGNIDLQHYSAKIHGHDPIQVYGKILDIVGLTIEASGPKMNIGDLCYAAT